MMRHRKWAALAFSYLLTCQNLVYGGTTDQVTVGLEIQALASAALTLSTNTISFADANPDGTPKIAAVQNPVSVTVEADPTGMKTIQLTVRANGHLLSGGDVINITNVTWTASGDGFEAGTMNLTDQLAGRWRTNRPILKNGSFFYFLVNSWNYAPGNYTTTVTYTLTAP